MDWPRFTNILVFVSKKKYNIKKEEAESVYSSNTAFSKQHKRARLCILIHMCTVKKTTDTETFVMFIQVLTLQFFYY